MADPFIGEIRMFAGNYAPKDWAFCNGQELPVAQNQALYSLISNAFGGDQTKFKLPDMRGRVPVHTGYAPPADRVSVQKIGQAGGQAQVALTSLEMPSHTHNLGSTKAAMATTPDKAAPALTATEPIYGALASPLQRMSFRTVDMTGKNLPHENRQPLLAVNFIIALKGLYPARP